MVRQILLLSLWLLVFSACASQSTANKAEPSVAPGANDRYATEEGRAAALQMLEGEGRDGYQKPDTIIENMKLKEGDVVCEVGSGSGYFTPFLSKAVGTTGTIYAEDPSRSFSTSTYHHFEWPKSMLAAMKRDTKARGRLVIVDWLWLLRTQSAKMTRIESSARTLFEGCREVEA